jgi:hypothetical protein
MKANGLTTRLMEKEYISILMELFTMEIGLKISKKAKEWKHGLMEQSMKEIINFSFFNLMIF